MSNQKSAFCHIPVSARMVRQPDGTYALDPERSVYADLPADAVARFLLEKFGLDAFGRREDHGKDYIED